jgi:hypothetical protein
MVQLRRQPGQTRPQNALCAALALLETLDCLEEAPVVVMKLITRPATFRLTHIHMTFASQMLRRSHVLPRAVPATVDPSTKLRAVAVMREARRILFLSDVFVKTSLRTSVGDH